MASAPAAATRAAEVADLAARLRRGAVFQGEVSCPAAARIILSMQPRGRQPGTRTLTDALKALNNLMFGALYPGHDLEQRLALQVTELQAAARAAQRLSSPPGAPSTESS